MGIIDGLKMLILGKPDNQDDSTKQMPDHNDNHAQYIDPWNSGSDMP